MVRLQRAADGVIAVWSLKLNGLLRAVSKRKPSRSCRDPNPLSRGSACWCVQKWSFDKMSGTAIIVIYNRLRQECL